MRSIIQLTVKLFASGEQLFGMNLSADLHSEFTGSPVNISAESGSPFSAFEGALTGTVLITIKPTLAAHSLALR